MYRIMIVEDDASIASALESVLKGWGFEACQAKNFQDITADFLQKQPDLVLMDLNLPGRNGFYWTQEIRKLSSLPIIFISSAYESMNVVTALTKGADDYITKPFDMTVLVTKIQALLRRSYDYTPRTVLLVHNGLRLDTESCEAFYEENSVILSRNEEKILKILMDQKGKIVSRETLMEALWKTDCYIDENTLSVNVNRLRRKLESIGVQDYIQTRKGQGYIVC